MGAVAASERPPGDLAVIALSSDTRPTEAAATATPPTVCHIFSGDLWAGAEVMIFNLLSALHEDKSLRLLALSLNDGELTERLRGAGITTHVIPESRHSLPGILCRAARILGDTPISIIHSHGYKQHLLACLLARWLPVATTVGTLHGLPEPTTNAPWARRLDRWRSRLNDVVIRSCFSSVVAVSAEMKRVLVERHGFSERQVRVIRNGGRFPARTASVRPDGGHFHIGSVGRMVPVKGFDLFLEIAASLRRQTPRVRFSILGDGPLRDDLLRRAEALKVADCVEFQAPRPDPFPFYQSLDVYLNTSLHEGLPLSVVEAMACGKPIVSAAVGGIPEIVSHGEHGFLVEGREPARFAESCLRLMRDAGLRTSMGDRASRAAHGSLSAAAMADAYRRMYEECGARRRG